MSRKSQVASQNRRLKRVTSCQSARCARFQFPTRPQHGASRKLVTRQLVTGNWELATGNSPYDLLPRLSPSPLQILIDEGVEVTVEDPLDVADLEVGTQILDHLIWLEHV